MSDLSPATMSVAEAAAELGQTEAWYLNQLRGGTLPGHKIGRKWRLTPEDVAKALELTARPATAPFRDPAGLTPRSRTHHTRQNWLRTL